MHCPGNPLVQISLSVTPETPGTPPLCIPAVTPYTRSTKEYGVIPCHRCHQTSTLVQGKLPNNGVTVSPRDDLAAWDAPNPMPDRWEWRSAVR